MKKSIPFLKRKPGRISFTGLSLSLILFLQAIVLTSVAQGYQQQLNARSNYVYSHSDTTKRWLSWNILFHDNASDADKDKYIQDLEASINEVIAKDNAASGNNFKVDFHIVHCPCDPNLTNLNATRNIGASGNTIPPKPPPAGGSGDTVSLNLPMERDARPETHYQIKLVKAPLTKSGVDQSKILAVMDTGLDPKFFETWFGGLIWKDEKSQTIRNFQFYHNLQSLEYMTDDDAQLHGTAVTTIAIQEFEKKAGNTKAKPRIMVLKVLDERAQGNTFSVSCGLSYVVQKKATLVNASLGYYSHGEPDPILLHYVRQCNEANQDPIPILAAAGNRPGSHNAGQLCNTHPNGNKLTKKNTFDPASLSDHMQNVISVTTIQNAGTPCFYQNFSTEYVSVGVANGSGAGCCKFAVPFFAFGYEGSSFATPFVSGQIMACLTDGRTLQSCRDQWQTAPPGSATVTKGGIFVPNP